MMKSEPVAPTAELRQRALVLLEEALKILDMIDMPLAAARLDFVVAELKDAAQD